MWPAGRNCLKIAYAAKIVGRFLVGAGLKPAPGRLLQNGQVSNLPLQRCLLPREENEATLLIWGAVSSPVRGMIVPVD